MANYIQCMLVHKGYLVATTIRTGQEQSIPLPAPVDLNDPDKMDLAAEDVKTAAKRQQKSRESLMKGYVMVYGQCSQEVCDTLKALKDCRSMT